MIDKLWFSQHWIQWFAWPLLKPLSLIFTYLSNRRKQAYLSGEKPSYRSPVPVIVVGNITAGGNGKTPMVIWLVERLQQLGYRPGVVSRGYGGKAPRYPLVVQSNTPTDHCGDEPKLIAERTGVPVAVSPVRCDAVKALLPLNVDVVITDDGLQHYALQRDMELIVIDGQRRFGNEQMIPLGPLREPISRCNSVDFLINNGGKVQGQEISMTLSADLAFNIKTGERASITDLGKIAAFAGIGHPPRFFRTLEQLGANLSTRQAFSDHQPYHLADIEPLQHGVDAVVMTEKDMVKCRDFANDNWWYLPISATFEPAQEQLIIRQIQEVIENYGSSSA